MRHYRLLPLFVLAGLIAGTTTSCSQSAPDPDRSSHVETTRAPIIGGQQDTTHQAVVLVAGNQSGCSGTIIYRSDNSLWVLTAAHCFWEAPVWVLQGDNYNFPSAVYDVVDHEEHPSYNPNNSDYDFGMLRATGANTNTPVIPAMSPQQDTLSAGSQILHVGYGLTSYPDGQTTRRHAVADTIDQLGFIQLSYTQGNGGPCSGDSGGPQLSQGGTELVAGVTSFGDQQCAQFGVSGRVSSVYDDFIVDFICRTCPDCSSDPMCNGTLGSDCTSAADCNGGACVDGVCCDSNCGGQCEACNLPTSRGRCTPVTGIPVGGRPDCDGLGTTCAGICDGVRSNSCVYPGQGTSCGNSQCINGLVDHAPVCDGAGGCVPSTQEDCAPYGCNGVGCATTCQTNDQCVLGRSCQNGACVVVQCSAHEDCGPGLFCNVGTCDGVVCATSNECPGALLCEGGRCVFTGGPGNKGGCHAAASDNAPASLAWLLIALVLGLVRRRRR